MPEKRITRSSKVLKTQTTVQPTLHDLFRKTSNKPGAEENTDITEGFSQEPLDVPQPIPDVEPIQVGIETVAEPILPPPSTPPPSGPIIIRRQGVKPANVAASKLFPLFAPKTSVPPPEPAQVIAVPNVLIVEADLPCAEPVLPPTDPTSPLFVTIDITQATPEPEIQEVLPQPIPPQVRKRGRPPGIRNGHSVDDPIVLDSSPVKAAPLKLFESRNSKNKQWKSAAGDVHSDAAFPDRESQHVRGPQSASTSTSAPLPFERRTRKYSPTSIPESSFRLSTMHSNEIRYAQPRSAVNKNTPPPILDACLQRHPAIRHAVKAAKSFDKKDPSPELWTDKWAPRKAEHVLGNEYQALFLRDWLKALALQDKIPESSTSEEPRPKAPSAKRRGIKRPRIRREVSRKGRKRQKMQVDDETWLVYDDYISEPETVASSDFDYDLFSDPMSDFHGSDIDTLPPDTPKSASLADENEDDGVPPLQYPKPAFSDLSNTIILCGPPGSGKTAAVYACAAELDWEVFEAYPGIGKRNGASLDNLVGQVGKNHLVVKKHNPKFPEEAHDLNDGAGSLSSFFSKRVVEPGSVEKTTSRFRPREPSSEPDLLDLISRHENEDEVEQLCPAIEDEVLETVSQVRQSLILLEEADILFKDDVNFWPTVVNIIKECRRPVILTCNDLSLIPTYDLPLQTTLYFAACPVPLAANYLINRSVAEGVQVSSTTLCAIQDSCSEPTAEPYFTSLRSDISECDLRRCIHELQFHSAMDRQTTVPRDYCSREQWNKVLDEVADWPVGETRKDRYLVTMGMHMENASLVDAGYIAHVDGFDGSVNIADEEVGYKVLGSDIPARAELAFYQHDILIARELLTASRGMFGESSFILSHMSQFSTRNYELDTARAYHRAQMAAVISGTIPSGTFPLSLPGSEALFLYHEPFLRHSVYYDTQQETSVAAIPAGGRRTKNSQAARHQRWVYMLDTLQRDRLAHTGFGLY